jgi:gliding motility-associated-like protein
LIRDNDSSTIRISISGAVNNDLASPGQGLCGVRIRFDHKYIGDLSMRLISPGGQSVSLIGPVGDAGFTFLSKWQVSFVPCNQQAVPDPGFSKKWNNLQPWGIFGQFYNGTYYPESGCLEDFNSGPVNGTWNLVVTDHDRFYDGNIESVCLLFCDYGGTTCNSCSPNGGYFDTTEISFCEGSDSLNLSGRIQIPFYDPDSNVYSYRYLIAQNDLVILNEKTPDLRTLPVGQYTVCGISYMTADSAFIPQGGAGARLSKFRNDIISNRFGICAELSKNCLQLSIYPNSAATDSTIVICEGDTIDLAGQRIFQAGQYQLSFPNQFGCDSMVNLSLRTVTLSAIINLTPDSITCLNPTALLDATSSIVGPSTEFIWNTLGGNFTDTVDIRRVLVDRQGSYFLKLQEGLCEDTASIFVKKNGDLPDLNIHLDTITCSDPTVLIKGKSSISGISWTWQDLNDIILSTSDSLLLSIPGVYKVSIVDSAGCASRLNFVVPADTSRPVVEIRDFQIGCRQDSLKIDWVSNDSIISFIWSGPDGFFSNDPHPWIKMGGIYKLLATKPSGCFSEVSTSVQEQMSSLIFILDTVFISCRDSFVTIGSTFNQNIQKIEWSGPGNFSSSDLDALVSRAGWYKTRVTDSEGCIREDSVEVKEVNIWVSALAKADKLSCEADSVQIKVTYLPAASDLDSIIWTGPNFYSTSQEPWVRQAGWYYLRMVSTTGCITSDSILVVEDLDKPDLNINAGTINCLNDTARIQTSSVNAVRYDWTGPGSFNSIDPSPFVYLPGIYSVTVTGNNGCQTVRSVEIKVDTAKPVISLEGDTITCIKDSVRLSANFAYPPDSVLWKGPFNFSSNALAPYARRSGLYTVWASSFRNGCVSFDSLEILVDTLKPTYQIQVDSITCSRDKATIRLISGDPLWRSEWKLPNGDTVIATTFQSDILGRYFLNVVGVNGCETRDTILLVASREKPAFSLRADTLTCRDTSTLFEISSSDLNLKYLITLPDLRQDSLTSFVTSIPGWYVVEARNASDCMTLDSINIIDRRSKPQLIFTDSIFTCTDPSPYQLSVLGVQASDSLFWVLPNGQTSLDPVIAGPLSGSYKVTWINHYGCISIDSIEISYDTSLISVFWRTDSLNCAKRSVEAGFGVDDLGAIYNWVHQDTLISTSDTLIQLDKAGTYRISAMGSNGCVLDTFMSVTIDTALPSIQLISDQITCFNPRAKLEAISRDSTHAISLVWKTPLLGRDSMNPIFVEDAGLYELLILSNRNACTQVYNQRVEVDTVAPKFQFSILDSIQCELNPVRLAVVQEDTTRSLSFSWTSPDGLIYWGKDSMVALVDYNASYRVIVRDLKNGCSADRNQQLTGLFIPINGMLVDLDRDYCDSTKPLELNINGIQGGTKPYYLSFDSLNYRSLENPIFIKPGTNRLFLKDSLGCRYDTSFIVPSVLQTSLIAYQDTIVTPGSPVLIRGVLNKDSSALASVSWTPVDFLDCQSCLYTTTRPNRDIVYRLTVIDTFGCLLEDAIEIRINKEIILYPPNAFSPNGDGVNDFFEIDIDPNLVRVSVFKVFDRWGSLVFEWDGTIASGAPLRWDGTNKGTPLNPGVFVFVLEYTSGDGNTRQLVGDFSLTR